MRRAHLLIQQIVGVYRFDGGIRGGLGYLAGELRGDHACALRALTHRGLRVNPEWSAMLSEFAVPIVLTHLDRGASPVWRAAVRRRPCVQALCRAGPVVLLGPADLDGIDGRVDRFVEELRRSAGHAGLSWTLGMHDASPAASGGIRAVARSGMAYGDRYRRA
jgi:hypothetical protein